MLKTTKNITLTGQSEIGGTQVVYMSSSISTDGGNNNTSKTITNRELYNANLTEVRADMDAFDKAVYATEDELVGGATV